MLAVTLKEFETYLYIKLPLKKASYYPALYRKAESHFIDKNFTEEGCQELLTSFSNLSPSAYNNYLKALKKLAACLGYTFLRDYKLRKLQKTFIQILDETELKAIIREAYTQDFRRAVALELFVRTGMRSEEVIRLEWRDYHISTIFIRDAKTRTRDVEILPDLAAKLESLRGNHPRYVFSSRRGNLSRDAFNDFLTRLLQNVGIKKHITMHKLRHSFASLADEKGVSLKVLMEILGHTDMRTTQQYIHTSRHMKKEAAKKVSLGEYKLTHDEAIDELLRYVNSLHSDESEIIINKKEGKLTVEVVKKK